MSWTIVLLSMVASAFLTLAGMQLLVWSQRRARIKLGWALVPITYCLVVDTHAGKSTYRLDPDYLIDTWETEDGLPENSATAMVQTADGYLWFGTFNGLVRFDGVKFTVFNPANTPGLPSATIVNMHLDRADRMWISTDRGLVVREGRKWRGFGTNEGWSGNFVRTFAERKNGNLLMTTFDGHLLEFSHSRLSELPTPPPGEPGQGYFGCVDGTGQWWVAQKQFVGHWDGQHWVQTQLSSPQPPRDHAVPCASARDGGVWILFGKDLLKYRDGVEVTRDPLQQRLSGGIWSLSEDSRTNVWIASYDSGLFRLNPEGGLHHWRATNGLSNDSCRFVFEDRESTLWVGTSGGGLQRFKPRRFYDMGRASRLSGRLVQSVAPSSDGGMWIATFDQGLFRQDPSGVSHIADPGPQYRSANGLSVLEDRAGRLWYGDFTACWWRRSPATFEKAPLPWHNSDSIHALFEDSQGRIWIAAAQGVAIYDGKTFRELGAGTGLPPGPVACFGEDSLHVPWVAAREGVFRYEHEHFSEVRTSDAEPLRNVLCFKAENGGAMWMGTREQGLLWLRDGRLRQIGPAAGLPVEAVHAIIDDDLGYFWLPSNRGIVRASRTNLQAVADGAMTHLDCQLLDSSDGLPSAQCPIGQPTSARGAAGRLWFATQKGVAMIEPVAFRLNALPPPVRVEQLVYLLAKPRPHSSMGHASNPQRNAEVRLTAPFAETIQLPPGSHGLEIDYVALSHSAPEKVRFQTRLDGANGDWEDVYDRRIARFYELRPGDHVFRVRAANNDGVWNETGASLAFSVQPFFWQTLWFKALGLAVLVAVVYGGFHQRMLRLEKRRVAEHAFTRQLIFSQENERKRVAAELHDGLGQDLLLIKNRLVLAAAKQADAPELARQLDAATTATARAIVEVRTISHALRPAALDQVGLTKAIEWMVEQLGEGATTKFSIDLDNIDGLLAPEMEMTLYRILQEALSNVIRHAGAQEAILEVRREETAVRASLFDDGCGFDAQTLRNEPGARRGLGLAGMDERIRFLEGSLDIQSAPGRGTRITVRVPLPQTKS
ncbi:MAG: two-component regulator propeller domain-containing protein [Verrucomicrobiia bacterium]